MARRIRVLIADDSSSVRSALANGLSEDPVIEVVGFAKDGAEALEQVSALKPDVVTLDIEMPRMDGIQALERIMSERPTPVIMVSSLTRDGAAVTLRALEIGAVDFALKSAARGRNAVRGLIEELRVKIGQAAKAKVATVRKAHGQRRAKFQPALHVGTGRRVIVIASSTGGPQALREVVPSLPSDLPAPVLVVQHLPATFTPHLAASLDGISPLSVREARMGEQVQLGSVLIAPGGVHMTVSEAGKIRFNMSEPECGVRPSANPTMESVAEYSRSASIGVILTGMGADGTRGAGLIKNAGGKVIAEDESTCVIYGMPKVAADSGHVDDVRPLPEIADAIVAACQDRAALKEATV